MVKTSDKLKYIKYNLFKTHPNVRALVLTAPILLLIVYFSHSLTIQYVCFTALTICIVSTPLKRTVWCNDYLIVIKYPISGYYYIYQQINKKRLKQMTCSEIYTDYFKELKKAPYWLPPGSYITVTQPMFTRALKNNEYVRPLMLEKAYKKKISKLHGELFLNRCENCIRINCPVDISNLYKQFFYIKFDRV